MRRINIGDKCRVKNPHLIGDFDKNDIGIVKHIDASGYFLVSDIEGDVYKSEYFKDSDLVVIERSKGIHPLCCPFCGTKDSPVKENKRYHMSCDTYKEEASTDYYLQCDGCGLTIGKGDKSDEYGDIYCDFNTEEDALIFWNKRYLR